MPVAFDYADESDPGPYPIPPERADRGRLRSAGGDRHVLVVDTRRCRLYELYAAYPQRRRPLAAGSGAVFDLRVERACARRRGRRPTPPGCPILPGLVRYDEVAAGAIDHAIRITAPRTRERVRLAGPPRGVGSTADRAPPMGLRLRLKASVDSRGFSAQAQVILAR